MRIGDIYKTNGFTFIILYFFGPYAYCKYRNKSKLINAVIPKREILEDSAKYRKVGYLNLEDSITQKLQKMEGYHRDRK